MTYKAFIEFDLTIADHPLQEYQTFPTQKQTEALWDQCCEDPDLMVGDIMLEEVGTENRWNLEMLVQDLVGWVKVGSRI